MLFLNFIYSNLYYLNLLQTNNLIFALMFVFKSNGIYISIVFFITIVSLIVDFYIKTSTKSLKKSKEHIIHQPKSYL